MDISLNDYIKPELLILIPVLMILGKFLKTSFVDNKHIPLILCGSSIVLSCLYLLVTGGEPFAQAITGGIVQGILIAGVSVFGHQIFKQYTNKETTDEKNDNE